MIMIDAIDDGTDFDFSEGLTFERIYVKEK
ncbi:MAG: hypothetical protein ACI90V_004573 [Bacillariaceae sp.]|jgi:hypothetical protein